mmetsp:Transcript_26608/g.23582  ORF Transcript_26608/g.23582 Transcript_26608/m.23582 type:complete len:131 (-) Transcript_26608:520-912(-)|eukprot:CAMPEP_0114587078 /NCGR_PEP_ID=MMETSP0125-20121206/10133_1 /TAXON_ID=485358 ORGANISM="Aristerostoma sp., Strain ATCC 50986" /NCGR_SAMPLE_ID=MMETSP0125 /ASSEMBLY_ACC=CAM_ASM_000245 /LENGTH=130 /DNA_ID=CAMNT_0001782819 /DNA_START=94 /DNA_END=486 /DNA_ORIENTATION=+
MQGSPGSTIPSNSTSPQLLIEIFQKFFKKIVEKEPNYEFYVQEWTKFKELLQKDPIDLDMVLIYISTLQHNLEMRSHNSSPSKPNDRPSSKQGTPDVRASPEGHRYASPNHIDNPKEVSPNRPHTTNYTN